MIRSRYWIAAAVLVVLMAVHTRAGLWAGDFWEHAAVVRELARHPFSPHHPLLLVDSSHPFFSPYALLVGLSTRATGASPVNALAVVGMLNLTIVLGGLRLLAGRLFPDGDRAAFWALLFILFLWGVDAWRWSGFLHFATLGLVLSYPSTFAVGLTLVGLWLYLLALDERRPWLHVPLALLCAMVLVTHPPTAVSFFAGLAACFIGRVRDPLLAQGALLSLVLVAAGACALLWPYFPFLDLLRTQSAELDSARGILYQDVPSRLWPTLVVAPTVLWRIRQNRRDVLVLWLVLLIGVYGWGAVSGSVVYGRAIAFIALVVQLSAAGFLAHLEAAPVAHRRLAATTVAVVGLTLLAARTGHAYLRYPPPITANVAFITEYVGPDDVVLSDLETSWSIPAHTGRIVAAPYPIYWIPDHDDRRRDVRRFFQPSVDDDERRAILLRWRVRYVLVDRSRLHRGPSALVARLSALGRTVAEQGGLFLVDVGRRPEGAAATMSAR